MLPVLLLAAPAAAQLGLPGVTLPTGPVRGALEGVTRSVEPVLADAGRRLAALREARIERLVRANPRALELTAEGYPARRGEILLFEPSNVALSGLVALGFGNLGEEEIDGLGIAVTRVRIPAGLTIREAGPIIERAAPGVEWTPDHVFEQSGRSTGALSASGNEKPIAARVGVIDGAAGAGLGVAATKGFAAGAPAPSNHGSAIVSLLRRAGARNVAVADVYGTDPAGGSASAVARGLGWLVGGGARVVTISLVGPDNPLLARAIAAAQRKGVTIVAAVGNDGPAAPPAYPASYPGVVSVTGVDGRNRALIEAGRALDLDYAAPGADIAGANAKGRMVKLRGTSFAAPLVAARIAAAGGSNWRAKLDAEAVDLGRKGPDDTYGRGLVCGKCR
ncbi:S8 family serine peptidase [Tsuneonella sp. YG55]|uniref:S8 family serine peptidase n=1 Tax=Tsuneonella litorea TaxID=2976475 RepID=A0A9X2W094_9SPHN|nr:S8 family serine peptidase [Tsuneonella litorea]MCT2558672.1 S8 family serine peptidase [Tsuneonella litorea]